MTTYLKDLTQSIGRYGGLSNKIGFKGFGCTSSSAEFLASKDRGKHHMLKDL